MQRQRQGGTSQRAGQEKEVKGKAKNGRELESNTHTHTISHTLGWTGTIICTKKPHGKKTETKNISSDSREKTER